MRRLSATSPNILVVDDHPAVVTALSYALNAAGFHVESCRPGPQVQNFVRTKQPQLVLLDVQMGRPPDGIELFRSLRADPLTSSTPVIFMTAAPEEVVAVCRTMP